MLKTLELDDVSAKEWGEFVAEMMSVRQPKVCRCGHEVDEHALENGECYSCMVQGVRCERYEFLD